MIFVTKTYAVPHEALIELGHEKWEKYKKLVGASSRYANLKSFLHAVWNHTVSELLQEKKLLEDRIADIESKLSEYK